MPHKIFYRNRLPHWVPTGCTVFVTFRTNDSLPPDVLRHMRERYEAIKERLLIRKPGPDVRSQLLIEQKKLFVKLDSLLDQKPEGECLLRKKVNAEIVMRRVMEYHNRWYTLQAMVVMPNHVHLLLDLSRQLPLKPGAEYVQLDKIMQRIKGGSARLINQAEGRTGAFWFKDSYDHWVRDKDEWYRIARYIVMNPVKAGLVTRWEDWGFTYCDYQLAAEVGD